MIIKSIGNVPDHILSQYKQITCPICGSVLAYNEADERCIRPSIHTIQQQTSTEKHIDCPICKQTVTTGKQKWVYCPKCIAVHKVDPSTQTPIGCKWA